LDTHRKKETIYFSFFITLEHHNKPEAALWPIGYIRSLSDLRR